MIHVAHFIMRGHRRVAIRTVDTDVVALSATVAAKFISLSMRINRSKAPPPPQCFTDSPAVTVFHLLQDAEKSFLEESGMSSIR